MMSKTFEAVMSRLMRGPFGFLDGGAANGRLAM
jgi:hypothetical protein